MLRWVDSGDTRGALPYRILAEYVRVPNEWDRMESRDLYMEERVGKVDAGWSEV